MVQNTDHQCLWVDLTFTAAFGHNITAVARPNTRRLYNRDPRIVANYQNKYEALAEIYTIG